MKQYNPVHTAALTKVASLRNKEKSFKTEAEVRLRATIEIEGAGLHQQVAEAVYEARTKGASWASIKRAYGTQDYATLSKLFDEAVSNGALLVTEDRKPTFKKTDGGGIDLSSFTTADGVRLELDEPISFFKWRDQWMAGSVVALNPELHAEIGKVMSELAAAFDE